MPRWVSNNGEWFPAKEKVSLINTTNEVKVVNGQEVKPGEPYIYEGLDRAAEFELYKTGQKTFGLHFKDDPELIHRARQLGYKDVMEYAFAMGYNPQETERKFQAASAVITKHELPDRKEAVQVVGGGKDLSGQGNDVPGGWGKPKDM